MRCGKLGLLIGVCILAALVATWYAPSALAGTNYVDLVSDAIVHSGDTYTFYYSVWGRANWNTAGVADMGFVDLGVVPWGNYSNPIAYSPGQAAFGGYPYGVSDYWEAVRLARTANSKFTPTPDYSYDLSPDVINTPLPQTNVAYPDGGGNWFSLRTDTLKKGTTSYNLDSGIPGYSDSTPDVYQGVTQGGAPIWLGGFSFAATHVAVGWVPYAIMDSTSPNPKTLGSGYVLGPTPEASTLILLGVTMLPFAGYRLRRRRKEEDEA